MSSSHTKPSQCSCTATITDPERKRRFEDIFPNCDIPIKYPLIAGIAETQGQKYEFYELDKTRVSNGQMLAIAKMLSPVFQLDESEIIKDFHSPKIKIPIKADSCLVTWCNLHVRCAL